MIKLIIACDNDCNLLSKINDTQIQATKVLINKKNIIEYCKNTLPDMLILDFNGNETIYHEIIKEIYENYLNRCLIISATHSRTYLCFSQMYLLLNLIKVFENFNDTTLEKNIVDMLWELRFNLHSKGTIYLKEAIMLAYNNNSLLYDTNKLVHEISKLYNLDKKNIRNNIDNALNIAFKIENFEHDITFFKGLYDGRKVSLKYFIALSVHYINIKINGSSSKILLNF